MTKEDLIKFYSIHKAQIFPVIVALSSLFLIIFVIYPQTARLISNQNALGDLNRRSEFLETKVVALESYDEGELSNRVGLILTTLPTDKDFGNVLGLLQQLTVQSGFSANSISFSNSASKIAKLRNFEVKLDIRGSKASLQTLLDNLENSPRLVRINSIDALSRGDTETIESILGVDALYSELPKDFGGIDSPLPELSEKDNELISKLEQLKQAAFEQGGQTALVPSTSSSSAVESPRGKSNPFE